MPLLTPLPERYKPHVLLKQGRFSTVSLVLELADHKSRVARLLKQPPGGTELELLEGLDRVARTLRPLEHPNVARFDKIVEGQGGTWLFFFWAEGSGLGDFHGVEHSVPDAWIIWWLGQILNGLLFLHQQEPPIVIGYLEPGDVVVQDDQLCICDLGIFEDIFPAIAAASVIPQQPYIQFIAPERRNAPQTAPSNDLFSASAIAFWLATGKSPQVTGPQVSEAHRSALRQARPGLPHEVVGLIVQGLSFYPSARPQTALDMLNVLGPFITDLRGQRAPAPPSPDNVQYRAQTTRAVFSQAEVPEPISLDNAPPPEAPAPPPLPWFLQRRTLVAVIAVAVVLTLWTFKAARQAVSITPGWMTVAAGQVLEQNPNPASKDPGKPITRIAPGIQVVVPQGVGTLRFGHGSEILLQDRARLRNYGQDGRRLSFVVFGGLVRVKTGGDQAYLHVPTGNVVNIEPSSEVEVDMTSTGSGAHIELRCKRGHATITLGHTPRTLEPGSMLSLTRTLPQ